MILRLRAYILSTLVVLFLATSGAPIQKDQDAVYFSETGHWVSGEILDFFQQTPDPLKVYGLPITKVFPHPVRPEVQVQYFQKARLELDPSAPLGQRVKLAPLGTWEYDEANPGESANIDTTNASCKLFRATGHKVCFAFMQFYEGNHGEIYFGQPISQVEMSGGRMVQYFEYARMEWRAEFPEGVRVVLTDLGSIDFDRNIADQRLKAPEDPAGYVITASETRLIVRAFPTQPIIQANSTQRINIIVQNQFHQPVKGAQVTVTITRPDGITSEDRPLGTNAEGFTQVEISVGNYAPNQTYQIDVKANLTEDTAFTTSSWFRIWW